MTPCQAGVCLPHCVSVETGAERLARHVRGRRRQLRLTQRQAAEQAGVSEPTWGVVENAKAENYADMTLSGIDLALGWCPGSARTVLEDPGHEPLLASSRPAENDTGLLEEVAELLQRVQDTLESRRDRWDRLSRGEAEDRRRDGAR